MGFILFPDLPGFLDEVPPRLEGCRQRLLAAEIELGRAEKAGGLDIGSAPPPEEKESDVPAVLQDLPPLFGPEDGPDEFADLPHEGEMLLEQVSELESQLVSMTGKFKDLDAGHVAARQLRNAYSSRIKSSTEQIASLAKQISELSAQLDVSQQHNEALKEKVTTSRANTQKLQRQLLASGKELSHSQYQSRKLEQLLESTRGVVDDYLQKLETSEAEQDNLRSRTREMERTSKAAREDYEQRIEELEEALQEAQNSMEEVNGQKEDVEREKQSLSESLQSQKTEAVAQQKIVEELRKTQTDDEQLKEKQKKELDKKLKEIESLNFEIDKMKAAQTRAAQPEKEHARPDQEEDLARIKKLEEALRDFERQKQEQDKLVEEKDKELEVLNRKLKDAENAAPREEQPPAEHASAEHGAQNEEDLARIKKLEEALRDFERQKQEQDKLVEEKDKELEVLNRKLKDAENAAPRKEQPPAEHASAEHGAQNEEDLARIKKLEEALRDFERQKQEQNKLVEEKDKELEVLNRKLKDAENAAPREEQPPAEHASAEHGAQNEEDLARIKKLEEALRDFERQKQEQDKLVEEKDKELEVLNRKLKDAENAAPREEQPPAEHALAEHGAQNEEDLARIKKLEEALRDFERQKQEQDKLVEEKDKELEVLNRKLKDAENAAPREEQPPAEHASAEHGAQNEEDLARIKKLEEDLQEVQGQNKELSQSLHSQQEATVAQEKLVEEKEKELETLNLKLTEMSAKTKEESQEPEEFAEATAKKAVDQWVESATQEEWAAEWDSQNISLTVPVVMTAGVYEHGRAPSRVGLKGSDFLIQPLLPAGPPQRLKLSNVKSIFAESGEAPQNMSLLLEVDEGGHQRQLQLSSDGESVEAILATLTRDVRVMPGEDLKGR